MVRKTDIVWITYLVRQDNANLYMYARNQVLRGSFVMVELVLVSMAVNVPKAVYVSKEVWVSTAV